MRHGLAAMAVLLMLAGAARADEPTKLMFVDTGNTGRSVSAEALADALIRQKNLPVLVISRAVDLDPFYVKPEVNAAELLRRRDIDVSAHLAAQVTANDVRHADLILVMTEKHKATVLAAFPEAAAKTFTISDYATGQSKDVVDAFGKPMEVYEQVLAQLDGYMPLVLEKAVRR